MHNDQVGVGFCILVLLVILMFLFARVVELCAVLGLPPVTRSRDIFLTTSRRQAELRKWTRQNMPGKASQGRSESAPRPPH